MLSPYHSPHRNGVPSPNNLFFPLLPTQSEISEDQGIKTFDYYLERNRVAGAPSSERNFHIFYYLFAGPAAEVRQHMQLLKKTMCWYLSHGSPQYPRWLSEHAFSKCHVAQTCQLIAAILHLGNLEFTIDRGRDVDAVVRRMFWPWFRILGCHSISIGDCALVQDQARQEGCTVFLDPDGAADNCGDLAKTLYSLLFSWLNERINERFCRDDFVTFIGLFDLPGAQNLTS
jgi:chitin synthase